MAVVSTPARASASVKMTTTISGATKTYSVPLGGIAPSAIGSQEQSIYAVASALAGLLLYPVTRIETSLTSTLEDA